MKTNHRHIKIRIYGGGRLAMGGNGTLRGNGAGNPASENAWTGKGMIRN